MRQATMATNGPRYSKPTLLSLRGAGHLQPRRRRLVPREHPLQRRQRTPDDTLRQVPRPQARNESTYRQNIGITITGTAARHIEGPACSRPFDIIAPCHTHNGHRTAGLPVSVGNRTTPGRRAWSWLPNEMTAISSGTISAGFSCRENSRVSECEKRRHPPETPCTLPSDKPIATCPPKRFIRLRLQSHPFRHTV